MKARGKEFWENPRDERHGTNNGYSNLKCRCDDCRAAWAASVQRSKDRRTALPVPEHLHGSENAYGNYGCRCRKCTDVWSAASIDRKRRRDARQTA